MPSWLRVRFPSAEPQRGLLWHRFGRHLAWDLPDDMGRPKHRQPQVARRWRGGMILLLGYPTLRDLVWSMGSRDRLSVISFWPCCPPVT